MPGFLLRKLLRVITVLLGALLITFLLMHAIPGNPWSNYSATRRLQLGQSVDEALTRELNRHFGLDLPLWRQFTRYIAGDFNADGRFICGAVCGNLGPSILQRGRSVQEVLFDPPEGKTFWQSQFAYSIRLVLLASLIAAGLGLPLGILSAMQPKSALSRAISFGLAALISIPNFVLGLLAIIWLASWLKVIKVLPDWNNPRDWIVPAVVLALMPLASIARVTSASLLNTLNEEYVRTARAKGASETRVMLVHVLRNALAPILTFLGPTLVEMFTGLFVVEYLFAFPGFGRGYWQAVLKLDYPQVLGQTLLYAVIFMLVNLLVEVLGEALDPRLRAAGKPGAL
jgi:oligopeptide transport system permease protein